MPVALNEPVRASGSIEGGRGGFGRTEQAASQSNAVAPSVFSSAQWSSVRYLYAHSHIRPVYNRNDACAKHDLFELVAKQNEWPGTYTVRSIVNHIIKRLPASELTFVEGSLYVARKAIARSSIKPGKLCEVELKASHLLVRPLFATASDPDREYVEIQQGKHYHSLIPVRPSVYGIYPSATKEAIRRQVSLQGAINSDEEEDDE